MGDSDDTCDFIANLSCSSSSFDEGEPLDYGQHHDSEDSVHYEVRPYQFQPERDESQGPELAEVNSVQDQAEQRLGSTFWCTCGNCSIKETVEECRCCKEISVISDKTKELNVDCIINHPGFLTVCLDEYVLEAAYYAYRQQYGNRVEIMSDRNRYTAYRQLVRWCWGYLGHEIRVALPSCAVDAIRQKFPSEDGNYTGFKHL
ncbi:hypothetical protein ACJMK2_006124 [Sinanodonta woodiana]|uniref:P2X purinoreceptor 7 intracellular domain-containing protein n=1 Tax=Sinanodonta woodiana TaxID=1069815 RepID=A0ABD3VS84_SINWO